MVQELEPFSARASIFFYFSLGQRGGIAHPPTVCPLGVRGTHFSILGSKNFFGTRTEKKGRKMAKTPPPAEDPQGNLPRVGERGSGGSTHPTRPPPPGPKIRKESWCPGNPMFGWGVCFQPRPMREPSDGLGQERARGWRGGGFSPTRRLVAGANPEREWGGGWGPAAASSEAWRRQTRTRAGLRLESCVCPPGLPFGAFRVVLTKTNWSLPKDPTVCGLGL